MRQETETTQADFRIAVQPGDGLIGRFSNGVMLLSADGPADASDRLIDLLTEADGQETGVQEGLAEFLAGPGAPEAFGAMVETGGDTLLYLCGPVEVTADSPNADLRAWGGDGEGLLRYEAPDPLHSLTIRHTGGPASDGTQAPFDLRSGVVSGSGLTLERPVAADTDPNAEARHGQMAAEPLAPSRSFPAPSRGAEPGTASMRASTPPPEPSWQQQSAPGAATLTLPQPAPLPAPLDNPPGTPGPADDGRPRPGYGTRLLSRVLLTVLLGLPWALLTPFVLPVGFAPADSVYTMVFLSLGLLLFLGVLVWDTAASVIQRSRARRDWPRPLFVLQVVPEALVVLGVQFWLLDSYTVNTASLVIHLGGTALLMAGGAWVLGQIPFMRARLHTPAGASSDAPAGSAPSQLTGASNTPMLAPAAGGGLSGQGTQVWGVNCRNGHFNRTDARYCAACGTAMHGLTREPVQGVRPPLGYLVSDSGHSYELNGDYTLGRAPESDERVRLGLAHALPVADPTVAGTHADVRLDQWDVIVIGRENTSGIFVNEQGGTSWTALSPGQPFVLQPGTSIRIGSQKFVYRALNQR